MASSPTSAISSLQVTARTREREDLNSIARVPSHHSPASTQTLNFPRITYDVWTYILDQLSEDLHLESHPSTIHACYDTLLACLLTAWKDWRNPVHKNLYSLVVLHNRRQANRFKDAIVRDPSLGRLVRTLVIGQNGIRSSGPMISTFEFPSTTSGDWIPFMRNELTTNLPNVSTVSFWGAWGNYPTRYQELVSSPFKSSITALRFRTTSGSLHSIIAFVNSLPTLSEIHVNIEFIAENDDVEPLGGGPAWSDETFAIETASTSRYYRRLSQPTILVIENGLTRLKNFPPLLVFGRSATHLTLHWDGECKHYAAMPPAALLYTPSGYIPLVSTLVLIVQYRSRVWSNRHWFHSSFGRWIITIVKHAAVQNIQSLRLRLWSQINHRCTGPLVWVSGWFILDRLFTFEFGAAIRRLPNLISLNIELPSDTLIESNSGDQELWWHAKIIERLPGLDGRVSVKVTVHTEDAQGLHSGQVASDSTMGSNILRSSSGSFLDTHSRLVKKPGHHVFPMKIYERILNVFRIDDPTASLLLILEAYQALLSCSLVNSSWYPRSQSILYSMVVIRSAAQTKVLVQTLNRWARAVYALRIEPRNPGNAQGGYIPFISLPPLPRLRSLVLHLDWSHYPSVFRNAVPQLYSARKLDLYILQDGFKRSGQIVQFLCRFGSSLEHLHMYSRSLIQTGATSEPWGLTLPRSMSDIPGGAPNQLKALKTLELQASVVFLRRYPAMSIFGSAVEQLLLHWDGNEIVPAEDRSDPNALRQYIVELRSLRSVVLVIEPRNNVAASGGLAAGAQSFASWVASVMSIFQLHRHALHFKVTMRFWPCGASWESPPRSRDAFLRELFPETSQRFFLSYLVHVKEGLSLELPRHEDDPPDMPDWWRRRILALIPWESVRIIPLPTIKVTLHSMTRTDTYAPRSSTSASNSIWVPVAEEPPSRAGSPERSS